jgi:P-type E1-E2 ATPase
MDSLDFDLFEENINETLKGLTFVSVLAMKDNIRDDAKNTIEKLIESNIRVRLVTGDHENSALSYAR